jgi:predicted nuclease with TOPRIM domain
MWSIIIVLALMIPLLAVILDSQLGRALAARLEKKAGALDEGSANRLTALESEVDRLNREVQRLEEQSEFMHRLLQERTPPPSLPSSPDGN